MEQFLQHDANMICVGNPELSAACGQSSKGDSMHGIWLKGPIVLQIDEISNVSSSTGEQVLSQFSTGIVGLGNTEEDESRDDYENTTTAAAAAGQEDLPGALADQSSDAHKKLNSVMKQYGEQGTGRERTANRMLRLVCTDGKNRVVAMEYQFVPVLSADTNCGAKVSVDY